MKKLKQTPVERFESLEQAIRYLKYWQKVLMLDSWIINLQLIDESQTDGTICGNCDYTFECKSALIRIVHANDETVRSKIIRECEEQTLVHELLHLKYNLFTEETSHEYMERYFDFHEHQKLDELANTLIMVKYNLPYEWFKNPNMF